MTGVDGTAAIVPQSGDAGAIMRIIERALTLPDFDLGRIEKLLELKERWDANEAKKAFTADMAAFKLDPPVIYKNKHVGFNARDPNKPRTDYDHATHAEVTYKIIAGLAKHGFSHRWIPSQPSKDLVRVECVITHRLGYSESVTMEAPPDNSGNKSPVQMVASTKTLLERYTILAATGLSTEDLPDADDRTDEYVPPPLPEDVKTALEEAAKQGSAALQKEFKGLSEQMRARIVADYSERWNELKAEAGRVGA